MSEVVLGSIPLCKQCKCQAHAAWTMATVHAWQTNTWLAQRPSLALVCSLACCTTSACIWHTSLYTGTLIALCIAYLVKSIRIVLLTEDAIHFMWCAKLRSISMKVPGICSLVPPHNPPLLLLVDIPLLTHTYKLKILMYYTNAANRVWRLCFC